MKNILTNIILIFIMIILMGAIIVFGMYLYTNLVDTDISNTIYTLNSIFTSTTDDENIVLTTNNENIQGNNITVDEIPTNNSLPKRFYYEQLTDTQKSIYDGLQNNKENMYDGKYKIEYGEIFTDILNEEGGSQRLGQDYQSAVETFLYDNPDIFFIDANKLFLSVETTTTLFKKTYNVYVGPDEGKTYYVDGFKSELQVKTAMKKIEDIRDNILKKLTGNTYKDILKIHDYLVENIEYDSNITSIGAYSIYGALIDRKCVCEGYAEALKYLLNAANIPCEIAQGRATNSSGKSENHAWNFVYLNKKWYYIDTTWDDPIIVGSGSIAKSIQYKYFLRGSKTFNKDHVLSNKFSDGGRTYKYPKVEEYDYN